MVGRGTDIKLGPGVKELGGLAVIGTSRMNSLRMDLQLRGRSGRQGDPGFSQFYVSLEYTLVWENSSDWVQKYVKKNEYNGTIRELTRRKFRKLFRSAQELVDLKSANSRMQNLQFDDILKQQREKVYAIRDWLMDPALTAEDLIFPLLNRVYNQMLEKHIPDQLDTFAYFLLEHFFSDLNIIQDLTQKHPNSDLFSKLNTLVTTTISHKKKQLHTEQAFQYYVKLCFLKVIDTCWINQVDCLDQIKRIIQSKNSKILSPLQEYQREATSSDLEFLHAFDDLTMSYLMLGMIQENAKTGELSIQFV